MNLTVILIERADGWHLRFRSEDGEEWTSENAAATRSGAEKALREWCAEHDITFAMAN